MARRVPVAKEITVTGRKEQPNNLLKDANKQNPKKQSETKNPFEQTHIHSWWKLCQPRAGGTDDSQGHVNGKVRRSPQMRGTASGPPRQGTQRPAGGRERTPAQPARLSVQRGVWGAGQYVGSARSQNSGTTCRRPLCSCCKQGTAQVQSLRDMCGQEHDRTRTGVQCLTEQSRQVLWAPPHIPLPNSWGATGSSLFPPLYLFPEGSRVGARGV